MTSVLTHDERSEAVRVKSRAMFRRFLGRWPSVIGTLPMAAVAIGVFVIGIAFTVVLSFTNSKLFPTFNFVGWMQYERLWATPRWVESVKHIWFYGFGHIAREHEAKIAQHGRRNFVQILLVTLRKHERLDARAMRSQDLLLQPADG